MNTFKTLLAAGAAITLAASAHAATVTVGPGGFDAGWATTITYDDEAARGTANDRDNPLNALGAADGSFFEIGLGSFADLTFGTEFDSTATAYEVTFGDISDFPESIDIYAGNGVGAGFGGVFVTSMTNADAAGGGLFSVAGLGIFETLRFIDTSPSDGLKTGGFDIDAVRVAPVPLPAAGLLLLGALAGGVTLRRRK